MLRSRNLSATRYAKVNEIWFLHSKTLTSTKNNYKRTKPYSSTVAQLLIKVNLHQYLNGSILKKPNKHFYIILESIVSKGCVVD